MSLDYRSSLFWAIASSQPENSVAFINTPGDPSDPLVPHDLYPSMLRLKQTGEVPAAIHFNDAGKKKLMDQWWGQLWWNSFERDERFNDILRSRLRTARARFSPEGDAKDWHQMCGGVLKDVDLLLSQPPEWVQDVTK
jgi:hypothetical protein